MNISEHVTKLRKYMQFRNYSGNSTDNYCSCFTKFLAHFEKQGITHPDRINAEMIISFLGHYTEPATHSGYHSAIKIYYEKVAHVGIDKFKCDMTRPEILTVCGKFYVNERNSNSGLG